jgi:CrcB protein
MGTYLLIALGGILGANARYVISVWAADRFGVAFPYGTFLINVSGSFVMGIFLTVVAYHYGNDPDARYLVATGFLGAYTTFSTFAYETIALVRRGLLRPALINALGSTATSVAGAALGIVLANMLGSRL